MRGLCPTEGESRDNHLTKLTPIFTENHLDLHVFEALRILTQPSETVEPLYRPSGPSKACTRLVATKSTILTKEAATEDATSTPASTSPRHARLVPAPHQRARAC